MTDKLILNEDRFFDSDPKIRKVARELYEGIRDLPIISPHGHTDPRWFAENQPFPDPTELIVIPDHYVFRMLYSRGISLESLGIPTVDGSPVEQDHRKIWQLFADNFHLFLGTPTGIWLNHEFFTVFGIDERLNSKSAQRIYDRIQEQLQSPDFLPRAMFDRFDIEAISTTDAAADSLEHHEMIRESDWKAKIVPSFRPDKVVNHIHTETWRCEIEHLGRVGARDIGSYVAYIQALERRREFFKSMGATSTDHAVLEPYTHEMTSGEVNAVFQRALKGKASEEDAVRFTAHMLMELARMSIEDGLVMQIHPGSYRNHNELVMKKFGLDKGGDIPVRTEYTFNLHALLNRYGNDPRLTLVLFNLDESTNSRELAPLAGHYPAVKLGPPWWFFDSVEGMTRFRQTVTETAGFYNTVGFNDDTRAFASIPARHDLSRRVDSNFLAGLVARHIIDLDEARGLSRALAYDLAKETYKL
ncbi:MAG: glucuronate isomerase [Fidelibacterota bacterium]|nr:MAG: glucuronate isomerase [Candidatus Neomarinimicrobiota bacterium]